MSIDARQAAGGIRGFRFPFGPDENGRFDLIDEGEVIEQSVHLILRTARGERVMRPDYGCGIHDLLYAPNHTGTHGRIVHQVREALERWEPRARNVEVTIRSDRSRSNRIVVDLHYTCPASGERLSLPHPLSSNTSDDARPRQKTSEGRPDVDAR